MKRDGEQGGEAGVGSDAEVLACAGERLGKPAEDQHEWNSEAEH